MGRRRSGGTESPALRYLKMRAWCSSSCHWAAVNGVHIAAVDGGGTLMVVVKKRGKGRIWVGRRALEKGRGGYLWELRHDLVWIGKNEIVGIQQCYCCILTTTSTTQQKEPSPLFIVFFLNLNCFFIFIFVLISSSFIFF